MTTKYTENTNWKDVLERAIWTGIQVVLGYLSADVILAVLDQWGVEIPEKWLWPLTVGLAFGISVIKNVVVQYRNGVNLDDEVVLDQVEVDDSMLPQVEITNVINVEDAYLPTETPEADLPTEEGEPQ